ncbi:hypothetical protein OEZ85_008862 [Tetradesmus obliquus]|uniref:Rhodanese domain-containing protein n=1 Tax=Tetradesmus obliquus TaxID=3088 RepID=A0ABY8TK13_TETOB|nr:hypothetical protein OEZ85_008862 [Tetradesmus obliquus]
MHLFRPSARPRTCKARSSASSIPETNSYSEQERLVDISSILKQCRERSEDFIFADDDDAAPVWEHEGRFKGRPMTLEELQEPPPQLFQPDPAAAVEAVVTAYDAAQGFREMPVQELDVALTAGGLIDLLLDVRSAAEFEAGPRIPGAVNIPLDGLSEAVRAGQLDQFIDGHVAVVCASGQRSAQATVRLSKVFNFQHVSNVAGGMAAWQALKGGSSSSSSSGGGCGCGGGGCH